MGLGFLSAPPAIMRKALASSILLLLLLSSAGALYVVPACCSPRPVNASVSADNNVSPSAHASCHHAVVASHSPADGVTALAPQCRMACCSNMSAGKVYTFARIVS